MAALDAEQRALEPEVAQAAADCDLLLPQIDISCAGSGDGGSSRSDCQIAGSGRLWNMLTG